MGQTRMIDWSCRRLNNVVLGGRVAPGGRQDLIAVVNRAQGASRRDSGAKRRHSARRQA